MSMTNARAYLRSRAKAIGLTEWKDGFDSSNIPDTILDKSFWIDMGDITSGVKRDQYDQEIQFPLSIKIYKKGYKSPADGIDDSVLLVENLIKEACDPDKALTQGNGIVNVSFDTSRIEPLSSSNNNSVVSSVTFNFLIILNV